MPLAYPLSGPLIAALGRFCVTPLHTSSRSRRCFLRPSIYHQRIYPHTRRHTAATYQPYTQHTTCATTTTRRKTYIAQSSTAYIPDRFPIPFPPHHLLRTTSHPITPHHIPLHHTTSPSAPPLPQCYSLSALYLLPPDLIPFFFFLFLFFSFTLLCFFIFFRRVRAVGPLVHNQAFSYRFRAAHALCAHPCLLLLTAPYPSRRRLPPAGAV